MELLNRFNRRREEVDERRRDEFLKSLPDADQQNIESLVTHLRNTDINVGRTKIAASVVGSSTKSEDTRTHPVSDIDIRVMNSTHRGSPLRPIAVKRIRGSIRQYLTEKEITFEEGRSTATLNILKGGIEWVDTYNTDPSFTTKPADGLPLHITISGESSMSMNKHLQLERRQKTPTVVLFKSK